MMIIDYGKPLIFFVCKKNSAYGEINYEFHMETLNYLSRVVQIIIVWGPVFKEGITIKYYSLI